MGEHDAPRAQIGRVLGLALNQEGVPSLMNALEMEDSLTPTMVEQARRAVLEHYPENVNAAAGARAGASTRAPPL